jgi:hypothetical protein
MTIRVIGPWPLATFGFSNRDKRSYFFFDSTHTRQRANGLNHATFAADDFTDVISVHMNGVQQAAIIFGLFNLNIFRVINDVVQDKLEKVFHGVAILSCRRVG